MLERATVCIRAGARDSLKCAQHAKKTQVPSPASRRRVHSTFRTHGVAEIDAEINLVATRAGLLTEAAAYVPQDDTSSGRAKKGRVGKELRSATAATPGPEGPFLGFLYPPRALAWLQSSATQPRERWERLNLRSLPQGFVQASRGYSSKSHTRFAEATSQDGSDPDDSSKSGPPGSSHVSGDEMSCGPREEGQSGEEQLDTGISAGVRFEPVQEDLDNATTHGRHSQEIPQQEAGPASQRVTAQDGFSQMVREVNQGARQQADEVAEEANEDCEMPLDPSAATISAGDLFDEAARDSDNIANPLEALRTIIGKRRNVQTAEGIRRAWFLYTSLSETAKADTQLMHELLLWFAKTDLEIAYAHSITLFWSLPLDSRTLTDYEAVLAAFLRRKTYDAARGVHKEALRNITNGDQITKKLFQHAVLDNNWQLALEVKEDLDSAFKGEGSIEARHQALFWIHVAELPDLIRKAGNFVRKCRVFERQGRKDIDKFTALSARMSEEAFHQILLAPWDRTPAPAQEQGTTLALLRPLLESIRVWNSNAPQLFEAFLLKLLWLNQSQTQYRKVHDIVSYIYGHYRKMQDVHFPENLLEMLLSRCETYASYLGKPKFSKHNITIEVIVKDWQKQHKILSCWAVKKLMVHYARQGMLEPLEKYYTYLKRHYPAYEAQKSSLWALIYVHARRGENLKAQEAFDHVDQVAKLNADTPDLKCWSILMHAHSRADDLVGGLNTLSRIVDGAKLLPAAQTIHPLLVMLARRGDSDGIADLLQQYDTLTSGLNSTSVVGSRMSALIKSRKVPEAEQRLKEAVQQYRAREITGSLTRCFNIMISAYARRRDLEGTMRTYRWMKAENISLDRNTYSGLMLALVNFRQTPAAYTIMNKVMQREGFFPTAIHYAIILHGLVSQRMYDRAIWVHQDMTRKNIRPSLATRRSYLKALAYKQHEQGPKFTRAGQPLPLMEVIKELQAALAEHDGSEVASKDPIFGHDFTGGGIEDLREHFVPVLFAHGKHGCYKAVHELFSMYTDESKKLGKTDASIPMRILVALMYTHLRSKEYDQVEAYWNIARDKADRYAAKIAIPDYQKSSPPTSQSAANAIVSSNQEGLLNATGNEVDRTEVGLGTSHAAIVQGSQTLLPASPPLMENRLLPGRRSILTRPFRYFLYALAAQNRIADVLTTFTALVHQGYTFDTTAWNRLIEALCNATPPLALLAFTLTERYLIHNFPGWIPRRMTRRPARRSALSQGLQYVQGRYFSYDTLVPQYRTMVALTAALLKLRRMEATGAPRAKGEIGRFVGTVRQIEAVAPRTLEAVNSMPQIEHDPLQQKLLRSDEANEL